MSTTVKVPDIGDFSDVPVIEVLVSEGDEVQAEDPLVTLESEKATMDVPAPEAGKVEKLLVSVDDTVSEGDPILELAPAEGDGEDEDSDSGDAEEKGGEEAPEGARVDERAEASEDADDGEETGEAEDDDAGETEDGGAGDGAEEKSAEGAPPYASPAVRRLARERGIDLSEVEGSGRKGRITKGDVEGFEPGRKRADAGAEAGGGEGIAGPEMAPWPSVDFEKYGPVERVELSRIKRISGPNLARNWVYIPHVTHHDEADITELEAFRKQINSEQDVKVTMVALLLKACVPVLEQFPEFNASLDGEGGLVLKRYYHLGFAADTPQGLLVPVIRDVDKKGLLEIAAELIELSAKAREGKIGPAEMAGSSFTISSLGGIGGTGFTPIVNAPEVAILGVTRSAIKPVWNGEEFEPRLMVPLSLSYDHRVVDGAAAARFCVALVKVLTDFRRALL
jgi:pyruvate dehydrogenase E2 component (dihydrolipoamide acetyltransferase)